MSTDLVSTRKAIARVNTGKDANEDSWMTMWCDTNWGELLQPAPMAIALLGSIMLIASSTDDFSLINTDDPHPYVWQQAKFPGSFKACLMQMVNEGYTAFGTAHKDMTRIQNATSQIPDVIRTAVYTIIKGQPEEVNAFLPDQIQSALELANICADAAKECEEGFRGIQDLAAELVLACTNQIGTSEQKVRANETQLRILQERKKSEEERVKVATEAAEQMKKSFLRAEDEFHQSINDIPKGWTAVAMQAVENYHQFAATAGNVFINTISIPAQLVSAKINGKKNRNDDNHCPTQHDTTVPTPAHPTQPSAADMSDPAIVEVKNLLTLTNALHLLVSGGPDGGPDWDKIHESSPDGSGMGGLYVAKKLQTIEENLDQSKPISALLTPLVGSATTIAKGIMDVAKSVQCDDDKALDRYKSEITVLIVKTQKLDVKADLMLKQPGTVGSGPATPPTPEKMSTSEKRLIAENAKFKVDTTRAHLEASRDAYDRSTTRLVEHQEQISKTIASLTSLSLDNATIKTMLPVLQKAMGAFATLQVHFSKINEFFQRVASLLNDVLLPSVGRWAKTMHSSASLGGVTAGDFTRQLIYTQMMLPLKVSMLSHKIAGVYLEVSDKYIMPAQRSVGGMLQFSDDTSPKGRAALKAKLESAQAALQRQAIEASKEIVILVKRDQKTFAAGIDKRLENIKTGLQAVLPSITQPVPKQITEVTVTHVEEFTMERETIDQKNAMFDTDDLM